MRNNLNTRSWISLAAIALLLSACGGGSPTPTAPAEPPTDIPAATPEPQEVTPTEEPAAPTTAPVAAEVPEPVRVEIPVADGLILVGTYVGAPGGPSPAVLFLHMYGMDRSTWSEFALQLQAAGIASLAVDLRGFGETGGTEDWALAIDDVRTAMTWLAGQAGIDPSKMAVVGASIGANLSMVLGAEDSAVAAIGLLSPGFDYFRVQIDQEMMKQYGARPALLAASEADGYSAETVRALAEAAQGEADLLLYPGSAHGTDLFDAQPDFEEALLTFLVDSLKG